MLPPAIQAIWDELQRAREDVLREVSGTSQLQADWRPCETDWSVGELIHHLTIAEIHTGKLTTKLIKEAQAAGTLRSYPAEMMVFAPLPLPPPGPAEAPSMVRPERGRPIRELIEEMKAVRVRSCESIERVASVDPRPLIFKHFALGELDLAQWWMLQARHDCIHLEQMRGVKATSGFPKA
jgi:hypothetical protein